MDSPTPMASGPKADVLGTVRTWDSARAFGWIEAGRNSLFVHLNDIIDRVEPRPGQLVKFMPIRTARGPRAVAVQLIEQGS